MKGTCTIEGCDRPIHARGWCVGHYSRWRKRRDLREDQAIKRGSVPLIDRLMAMRVLVPGPLESECWLAPLATHPAGYLVARVAGRDGREVRAHRYVYEEMVGPIPEGLHLDHLCRVRACWNPAHLEPVTARENMLRGNHRSAVAHRTGICPRGHSLEDAYEYRGRRSCRTCKLARDKFYRGRAA